MEMEANVGTEDMEDKMSISSIEGFCEKMNILREVRTGNGGRSIKWEDHRSGLSVSSKVSFPALG